MKLSDLANARYRAAKYGSILSRTAALARTIKTAFLSHSHKDADYAKGLQVILAEQGLLLYIDWEDPYMPEKPERRTAERIQHQIRQTDLFIFLATPNSTTSRWCPWEIGFADGVKQFDSIFVVPTSDNGGWYGNEYLQLYRSIRSTTAGGYAAFGPGQSQGVLLKSL